MIILNTIKKIMRDCRNIIKNNVSIFNPFIDIIK